jgi:hypothetical protein
MGSRTKQVSFSEAEFFGKKRVTCRERLPAGMDHRVPWPFPVAEIEPFHSTSDRRGRPPIGVQRMLRMVERDIGEVRPKFGKPSLGGSGSRQIRRKPRSNNPPMAKPMFLGISSGFQHLPD